MIDTSALVALERGGQGWEINDRTGKAQCLLALEWAVVLERRPFGMAVRVTRRDVERVQHLRLLDQGCGDTSRGREIAE